MVLKHIRFLLLLPLFLAAGCSDDSQSDTPDPEPDPTPTPDITEVTVNEKAEMKTLSLSGFVKDAEGNLLSGVTVTTGEVSILTDESGTFSLSQAGVVSNRTVIHFTKNGYFSITRSVETMEKDTWEIIMIQKGNNEITSATTYPATSATELKVGKMKIQMPQNGYCVQNTGNNYTGNVTADVVYLNPTATLFSTAMPGGDLAAVRQDNSNVSLVSYGIVGVNLLSEDGRQLQLADGQTATLTYPIPDGMDENLPESIPLWYFNEKAGLWIESGVAQRNGNEYVGKVKHFSFYNLDDPKKRAAVQGTVLDTKNRPVTNIKVRVGQLSTYTDRDGAYHVTVPTGTSMTARILPDEYGNYGNTVSHEIPALEGEETYTIDFEVPCVPIVTGQIINTCSGSSSAVVWLSYDNNQRTIPYQTETDGLFTIYAPQDYIGAATLNIQTSENNKKEVELQLTGEDITLSPINTCDENAIGGVFVFKLSDGTIRTYEFNPTEMEGVIVVNDNQLILSSESVYLGIPNYSPDKTSYSGVDFGISDNYGDPIVIGSVDVNIKYNAETNTYTIDVNGTCIINPGDGKSSNGTAEGRINVYLILDTTTRKGVTSVNDLNIPSFAPAVQLPIDLAMQINKGKMGKGVILNYKSEDANLYNDYKAQADKLNYTEVYSTDEEDYKEICYQSGEKVIMIMYDTEGFGPLGDEDGEDYYLEIIILDGCKIDVTESRSTDSKKETFKRLFRLYQARPSALAKK